MTDLGTSDDSPLHERFAELEIMSHTRSRAQLSNCLCRWKSALPFHGEENGDAITHCDSHLRDPISAAIHDQHVRSTRCVEVISFRMVRGVFWLQEQLYCGAHALEYNRPQSVLQAQTAFETQLRTCSLHKQRIFIISTNVESLNFLTFRNSWQEVRRGSDPS